MRLSSLTALFIISVPILGCVRQPNLTPDKVGAHKLTELGALPPEQRDAVSAAIARLSGEGIDAADFYLGPIEQTAGGRLELPLWYKSAFDEPAAVGNPGGKSRTMVYDTTSQSIAQVWLWQ